jgi:archaellin
MQAASAALVVDGPVYGYSTQTGSSANLTTIIFWLKTASGADSIDLNVNKTTIAFQNSQGVWPNVYNSGGGSLVYTIGGVTYTATNAACSASWEVGSGYLLDRNEKVRITIDLTKLSKSGAGQAGEVMKNEQLKVIVKPPQGSVLTIVRYAPAEVRSVNDLT